MCFIGKEQQKRRNIREKCVKLTKKKKQREKKCQLCHFVTCLKGLRFSCLLMELRYDNADTKPVYRDVAGCSQVEAI